MKGFYFINTDIDNKRAHTNQILNTLSAVCKDVDIKLCLIAPKYQGKIKINEIKERYNLRIIPKIIFLKNFGIKKPTGFAFILFNFSSIWFLFKEKLKKEIDFIYIRSGIFMPLVIFARILGVQCYYETHRKPMSLKEKFNNYIISSLSSGIIVISEYMKKYFLKYKKEILVVHDAVSLEIFDNNIKKEEARKKLNLPLDKNICVYTGAISKLKGLDCVFKTVKILPNVLFVLAGDVSREFENTNFSSNIKFLGKIEHREIPFLLKSADILLLPHPKSEYSQSPMKLFEYMASGAPIVASKLPSITEVLNDENAVLVEAENAEALASGIKKVLENKIFVEKITKQALIDVKEHTWKKRGEKISRFIIKTTNFA